MEGDDPMASHAFPNVKDCQPRAGSKEVRSDDLPTGLGRSDGPQEDSQRAKFYTEANEILDDIEKAEPTLAITIRDQMFRFEDFLGVPERELRELMNSIDKKTLMVALKSASEDIRSHFYRTMSSRAIEMLKEDSEMMGPVRSREVAKAQAEIVSIARKLESEGKVVLKAEGEDEYVL